MEKRESHIQQLPTIVKGSGINLSGTVFAKVFLFLYTILIARILSVRELGLYSLGITTVTSLAFICTLGMDFGMVRFVSIFQGKKDAGRMKGTVISALSLAVPAAISATILLVCFAGSISRKIFNEPALENILKLLAILIPFMVIMRIFLSATLGFKLTQYRVYVEDIGETTLRCLFILIFFFWFGLRLHGVIFSIVLSTFFSTFLAFYFINKLIHLTDKRIKPMSKFKELLIFSLPLVFSKYFAAFLEATDTFMIGYFKSAADVGIYTIVMKLVTVGVIITNSFRTIFNPIAADLHHQNKIKELEDIYKTLCKWILLIEYPLFSLLIISPKFFLHIFGKKFIPGSSSLIVLCIGHMINDSINLSTSIIIMSGRSDLILINNIIACMANGVIDYLLVPRYGILGAAIGTTLSLILLNLIRLGEVFYLMRIHPFRVDDLKPLIAGVLSIAAILTFQKHITIVGNLGMIFLFSLFLGLYGSLIWLFKLSDEDLIILKLVKNRVSSLV